jgi:hypothetical protein
MLAQAEVEEEMTRLSALCEKVTHEITRRGVAAAEADAAYRLAYAEAYMTVEGTVGERDAQAVVATQAQYRDRRIAEARLEGAKEAGRNYRAQLETLRSINANLRPLVAS